MVVVRVRATTKKAPARAAGVAHHQQHNRRGHRQFSETPTISLPGVCVKPVRRSPSSRQLRCPRLPPVGAFHPWAPSGPSRRAGAAAAVLESQLFAGDGRGRWHIVLFVLGILAYIYFVDLRHGTG